MIATLSQARDAGFLFATFPHNESAEEFWKEVPGARCWRDKARGKGNAWAVIPMDMRETYERMFTTVMSQVPQPGFVTRGINEKLYPYQQRGVAQALQHRRHIFADEMGLGKTPQAIEAARLLGKERVLVVCPAVVRVNWMRELDKWWADRPEAALWDQSRPKGKKPGARWDAAREAPIQVISYGLVHTIPSDRGWDVIILDEAHRLQSTSTKWSKAVKKVVRANPNAAVFGLTATPMPDQPKQVWNIVDTLWPGLWGKEHPKWGQPFNFMDRYCNREENKYGTKFTGVNQRYVKELRERLEQLSTRTTKEEVAHLLPPCNVNTWRLATKNTAKYKLAIDREAQAAKDHQTQVSTALLRAGEEKLEHCKKWMEDAILSGENICVMTYHRELSKQVLGNIAKGRRKMNVGLIDGNMTPAQRQMLIDDLVGAGEQFILVCTIKSVEVGIDLTACTQVLFLEMAYQPATMVQALGRFHRLSGTKPSVCTLMVLAGTIDEIIADKLEDKMEAINASLRAGITEKKLEDAFAVSEEQWDEMVQEATEGWEEEDGYGF